MQEQVQKSDFCVWSEKVVEVIDQGTDRDSQVAGIHGLWTQTIAVPIRRSGKQVQLFQDEGVNLCMDGL